MKKGFLSKLMMVLLIGSLSSGVFGQTFQIEDGTSIQDGGALMIGKRDHTHVSCAGNQIQAMYDDRVTSLLLNRSGGTVVIGGSTSENTIWGNFENHQ